MFVGHFCPPESGYGSRDTTEFISTALLKCKLLDKLSKDKLLYYKEKKRKTFLTFKNTRQLPVLVSEWKRIPRNELCQQLRCEHVTVVTWYYFAFNKYNKDLLSSEHGVIIVVDEWVVTLELRQLDVDDELFVPLGHQARILILRFIEISTPKIYQ